jgi:SHS2 domain-containing protein
MARNDTESKVESRKSKFEEVDSRESIVDSQNVKGGEWERGQAPEICAGVRAIDHTADVGIEVRAVTLEELFDRAAHGAFALVAGEDDMEGNSDRRTSHKADSAVAERERRELELASDDVAGLLASWLRELLFFHEVGGLSYAGARFDTLDEHRLRATVDLTRDARIPVREIKGVTYHGLEASRDAQGWRARVIFDV